MQLGELKQEEVERFKMMGITKNTMHDLEQSVITEIKELIIKECLRPGHVDGPWKTFAQRNLDTIISRRQSGAIQASVGTQHPEKPKIIEPTPRIS